jgi:transposase
MGKKLYNQEFKKTIVDLLESGKTPRELYQEYGVSLASINRWKKEFSSTTNNREDLSVLETEKQKVKALEKELKEMKLERDILKKAVSIFSKSDR